MQPLRVTGLKLSDFRNYSQLALILDGRHVVLAGENGAGKTNILEALSYLSPGRGMRRSKLEDVARHGGAGGWAVAATLFDDNGDITVGTGLVSEANGPERQRRIRIDGAPARSSDELLDYLRVLWLTPAMDGLFTGTTSDRRRFLDRLVLAIDRDHGKRVTAYERAMRERNRLFEDGGNEAAWFDGLEAQMAELGVAIAAARAELVACFARLIAAHHDATSPFPDAELTLDGALEADVAVKPAVEVEDEFRNQLGAGRMRDRTAGRALVGPHRSDLVVRHGPKGMPASNCSTGEQKALLLGVVLAHARLVEEMTGRTPILLLDEVAAHLDRRRRAGLFDTLDRLGVQAWMTGTDMALFEALGNRAQRFEIAAGAAVSTDT